MSRMNPSLTLTYLRLRKIAASDALGHVLAQFTGAAAELYRRLPGGLQVFCAKLHHDDDERCIFRCRYRENRRMA